MYLSNFQLAYKIKIDVIILTKVFKYCIIVYMSKKYVLKKQSKNYMLNK